MNKSGTYGDYRCIECGNPISAYFPKGQKRCPSHGEPKFCSLSCSSRHRLPIVMAAGWGVRFGPMPEIRGENHYAWRGGISGERKVEMNRAEYRAWRKSVYERDDFTCVLCHERGGKLQAHHVYAYAQHSEKRLEVDNGLTLCVPCHRAVHRRNAFV